MKVFMKIRTKAFGIMLFQVLALTIPLLWLTAGCAGSPEKSGHEKSNCMANCEGECDCENSEGNSSMKNEGTLKTGLVKAEEEKKMTGKIPPRDAIDQRYKWRINDIYATPEAWEDDFESIKAAIPDLAAYKGRLAESAKTLLSFLKERDEVSQILSKAYVYAFMKRDENTKVQENLARLGKIANLATEMGQKLAFFNPEILEIPEDKIHGFMEEEEGLRLYEHVFNDLLRTKKHTLTEREEEILAATGNISRGISDIFTALTNADLTFPVINDEEGHQVATSNSLYYKYRGSKNRKVRKENEEAYHGTFRNFRNSLASMMQTNVNRNRFYTQIRRYDNCLERALFDDNIPAEVYKNLVRTVNENLEPLHRYTRLRKKILGVDKLHGYDLYCSLFPAQDMVIPYEEAVSLVRDGLKPLGEDYMKAFNDGMDSGWVDVYENEGKRSGAYSTGVYSIHPYVLHNYHGTLNDVFTLAHEMGHALHSYYTHAKQPYVYASYPIFAAEIASTANEALLMQHMLKKTEDEAKKLYLLDFYLDQIRQTFYRQTLFAEFEMIIHDKAEAGETLTADLMDQVYGDLFQKYYGPELVLDDFKSVEWSRIPHFYRNFYVYTYATGISAGTAFAKKILDEGETARDRYVQIFLSGGSSDYAINLLKDAGLDMTSPEPILATIEFFDELLDELEKLLDS